MPQHPLTRQVILRGIPVHLAISVGIRRNEFVPPYALRHHYRPGTVDDASLVGLTAAGVPIDRDDPLWAEARAWVDRNRPALLDAVRDADDVLLAQETARDAALCASVGVDLHGRLLCCPPVRVTPIWDERDVGRMVA